MKKSKRWYALTLVFCMCLSLLTGCSNTPSNDATSLDGESTSDNSYDTSDTVIIPVLTNLNQSVGESVMAALTLAKQEIEAEGGFGGRTIEFEYIEVGTDQQASITASQKAASVSGANAIIGFYKSQWQIAANDIFAQAQIPTMCLGNSVAVSEMGNDYVWITRCLDNFTSAALADVATDTVGLKNPAIIYFANASGMSQYEYCKERLNEKGVEFAIELVFEDSTVTDFTSIITQLKASDADGVIVFTTGGEDGYLLASQLYDQGYDLPICAGVSMMATTSIANSSGGLEGWYGVTECSDSRPEFSTYYENVQQIDGWPEGIYPAWTDAVAYDTLHLLAQAAEIVGSVAPEAINEGLKQITEYNGAMYDYYYSDTHSFGHQMFECHIQDGQVVAGEQFYVE